MHIIAKSSLVVFLVFSLFGVPGAEVILKRGHVKYHNSGPKSKVQHVQYFDPSVVRNSRYLRVLGKIRILPRGSVRDLGNLATLRLSLCGIQEVRPGAFLNLHSLTTLSLKENDISHIHAGVFNNLTVSSLYLHKNQIETIERDAFNDMPNLRVIKLNSNNISAWDSNWFKNTPQLTELFFRRNQIAKISGRAFKHLRGGHTTDGVYSVDTKIYLSKNRIASVDPTAFEDLTELEQLWLDRNELVNVPENLFAHMKQVSIIFLAKNRLRSLPANLFDSLKADMITLDLTANHNFSCPTYEIVSRVKITTLNDIRRLNCTCVKNLIDTLGVNGKDNEVTSSCDFSKM